jgi:hypothetical protein
MKGVHLVSNLDVSNPIDHLCFVFHHHCQSHYQEAVILSDTQERTEDIAFSDAVLVGSKKEGSWHTSTVA